MSKNVSILPINYLTINKKSKWQNSLSMMPPHFGTPRVLFGPNVIRVVLLVVVVAAAAVDLLLITLTTSMCISNSAELSHYLIFDMIH